ncbi:hypothetical protein L207DRAFT_520360 [Hyaloscypha variabilis F]|uniref:Heterokaryon incompatibility domain-containing protein n=1 Tax=Hyaloscypha variabilis (strain UAMH 11265 / GT02V1 / F) TaxID=1149755 RepID=A0A2J6QVF4_HYAVF|nr:hypothetical protein L207DRAFT_520360 [Hyaloscypha variabilis F]
MDVEESQDPSGEAFMAKFAGKTVDDFPDMARGDISSLYQPLDESRQEIRIIRLLPFGRPNGAVHCLQETVSLLDKPKYNAVSYAWGDFTDTVEIICNVTVVQITKAVESALRHLRDKIPTWDSWNDLWIDGLCINQNDLQERSKQVLIMDSIYRQACCTIVWLGEEAEDSAYAMSMIKRLGADSELDGSKPETWLQISDLFEERFWTSIDCLFGRRFWDRLWVLQETTVATGIIIMCGNDEVDWVDLDRAFHFWDYIEWHEPWKHFPDHMISMLTHNKYGKFSTFQYSREKGIMRRGQPLLVNLNSSVTLLCSDPRDKVYALLGISNDDDKPFPDYSKSVRDVYTELLSTKLQHGQNIVTILFSGSGIFQRKHRTCDLPSWICDWAAWSTLAYKPIFFYQRLCFKAAGQSESTVSTTPGSEVLRTKGIVCEKIVSTKQWYLMSPDFWTGFLPRVAARAKYPTGIPILQALFRTVLLDNDRGEMRRLGENQELLSKLAIGFFVHLLRLSLQESDEDTEVDYEEIGPLKAFRLWLSDSVLEEEDNSVLLEQCFLGDEWKTMDIASVVDKVSAQSCYNLFENRASHNQLSTVFFETEQGYFGIGPLCTMTGDKVCVLPGLSVPLAFYRHETHFELIGPCFLLGFMDGEALDLVESGKLSLQEMVVK